MNIGPFSRFLLPADPLPLHPIAKTIPVLNGIQRATRPLYAERVAHDGAGATLIFIWFGNKTFRQKTGKKKLRNNKSFPFFLQSLRCRRRLATSPPPRRVRRTVRACKTNNDKTKMRVRYNTHRVLAKNTSYIRVAITLTSKTRNPR